MTRRHSFSPSRRAALLGGLGLAGTAALAACDRLVGADAGTSWLTSAEGLTRTTQRALLSGGQLAREFREADLSPVFKANGTEMPEGEDYARLLQGGFADYRLEIGGTVLRPQSLSLAEIRRLPARTQITRHDCVEGWSAIGKWTGVPLGLLLQAAGLMPDARYVVLHCADEYERTSDGNGRYYESIDLVDAFHPQTILAYGMNGRDLPVAHGAPLRLRVERQLGYKHAKYVMRLEVVAGFAGIGRGRGGFWPDRGYEWYAGI